MKLTDSSCLICVFSEINRPFILLEWINRGYQIVITDQVNNELQNNQNTYKLVDPEIKKGNIKINKFITDDDISTFRTRYPVLGVGESSVILTALKLKKDNKRYYAILDDGNARKVAGKLGINLTGTYGLLKTLKEKGHIDEDVFNQCKCDMHNSKFRIKFDRIK